jgi:CheY-like chemotaxis protein/two-component sensor histidine kinase
MLAGGIAHDFNNLLMVILGYADALGAGFAKEAPEQADLREITEAAQRAANLTSSLLAFSRRQPMEAQTQDLSEVVRRVEKLLRRVIGEDVKLETALDPAALYVHVDGAQIEQVLINLCTNARDAMPRGGRITISTQRLKLGEDEARAVGVAPGGYARLSVADTGSGMDEATRTRIFEPFFTTKGVGRGTGLGLSIVYGVVKQHDGQISVESAPDAGTTFRILLSLDQRGAKPSSPGEQKREPLAGDETILLAEDDEGVRRLIELVLRRSGYRVLSAGSGREAVELFRLEEEHVALVISDLVMPELDGREATDAMRRLRPTLEVLFLSGYTAEVISGRAKLRDQDELLMKPVEPEVLLRKVRELLDRARAAAK